MVRLTLPRTAPRSPSWPISRSTVHRATLIPSRFKASHTFRGPYTPKFAWWTRVMCSASTGVALVPA